MIDANDPANLDLMQGFVKKYYMKMFNEQGCGLLDVQSTY